MKKTWTSVLLLPALVFAGSGAATAASNGELKLVYTEWDSCVAATNVAAAVLEQAGYQVTMTSTTGAINYVSVASGDADAFICGWLPVTHGDYWEKTKDKLDKLGPNMTGARLGLAVPVSMQAESIKDLAKPDVAKSIDNRIIGIDPGAGLMRLTHDVIKHYALPETLVDGTDATMTAVLADEIRQDKPVVVTSWVPHWMFAAFDLKFLDDPDEVYGKPDDVYTIVRKTLQTDDPKAYAILDKFRLSGDERSAVMVADRKEGADPKADARAWVEAHQDQVKGWLAD